MCCFFNAQGSDRLELPEQPFGAVRGVSLFSLPVAQMEGGEEEEGL